MKNILLKIAKFIEINWFKLLVIILLLMSYARLGEIKDNSFYTADVVEEQGGEIQYYLEDIHQRIDDLEGNVLNYLSDGFNI